MGRKNLDDECIAAAQLLISQMAAAASVYIKEGVRKRRSRRGSTRRERPSFLELNEALSEEEFRRSYRMGRARFNQLVTILKPLLRKDDSMAKLSSGGPISIESKVRITLRFLLAGATSIYEITTKSTNRPYTILFMTLQRRSTNAWM